MRITQNMMTRNYLKTAMKNQSNLARSMQRMASGQKYTRISENVSEGIRALRVHDQLADSNQYLDNIRDAESDMAAAEGNLKSMNEVLQSAHEKVIAAKSDTYKGEPRRVIAKELLNMRDQMVQFANAQYNDKYIFSGTNNSVKPFAIDESTGRLSYNGVPVDSIYKKDGQYYVQEGAAPQNTDKLVPQDEDVYIDLGLGLRMTQSEVDAASAFKLSFSGLDILGAGTETVDGVEVSNNLINLLTDLAAELNKPEGDYSDNTVGILMDKLSSQTDNLVLNMTEIGTRCNFMEKISEQTESDVLNLTELQQKLEIVPDTEEAMHLKEYEYAWMLTLQFGGNVLPKSLMDFVQ